MRFTYHIGLHCTDEDRALKCLLANSKVLSSFSSAVPRPGRFRPALREAMLSLKGEPAPPDMQERLLDALLEVERADHVLFSSDSFLCVPQRAVSTGCLYPLIAERAHWIRQLFPDSGAHFCLALRNLAGFLPAVHARTKSDQSFSDYCSDLSPNQLSWHDMVVRLKDAVPDATITIWCNEDAPVLWPEILATLSGDPERDGGTFRGWDSFLGEIMVPDALSRLQSYLADHPPRDAKHRRRVISAFLDRFAERESVQEEFTNPIWTSEMVQSLTERYEADVVRIGQMPGITLMTP